MKKLLTLCFLGFFMVSIAQSKVKSFYFFKNQSVPSTYSQIQLDLFLKSMENGMVKLLEINSFTDSIGTHEYNHQLSESRLLFVKNKLKISNEIKTNVYCFERPYEIANVLHWRRVDIVYEIIPQQDLALNIDTIMIHTDQNLIENLEDDPEIDTVLKNEYSLNIETPSILNISFYEGTSKIIENSHSEIKKLADFLLINKDVKAMIRGHVCCGNNMRISKSRAKAVCKQLQKNGVDKKQISFKGMSNSEPLVFPEKTSEDRQKNRRVDVKFYH